MPLTLADTSNKEQLEHERLTSLINSMADAVVAIDEKNNIVLFNSSTLNILDVNSITLNSPLKDVLKPMDKNDTLVNIDSIVADAKVPLTNTDLKLAYRDGSKIRLYLSIAPVHLGYGEEGESGYVLLLRDITREKSLEEEREEFISVVSHELRTPVAITEGNISNAQYIADKNNLPATIKDTLKQAHNQVLFLGEMINDLSTLSRAERGMLKVDIEGINVHELLKEIADNYTPQAAAKGLEFKTVIDPKLELLQSSRLYVKEILQNFVTNALKYTERGSVTLSAKAVHNTVEFSITDTGIGISKADQQRVYEQFFRSEDFRTRKTNGTGLGLYVTMKLSKLIGADLKLVSELNKGSTFSATIPNLK